MTRLYRNLSTNHDRVSRSLLIKTTYKHHADPQEELQARHQALVVDRDVRCCHGLRSLPGYVSSPSRCRFPLQIYMIALKGDATPAAVCIRRTIRDLSRRSLVFARPSLLASDGHRRSVDASSRPPQPPSPRPNFPEVDERAFLLAVQKARVSAVDAGEMTDECQLGLMTATVGFHTGPNAYPYGYNVTCHAIEESSPGVLVEAPTCAELSSLTPVGDPISGNLPLEFDKLKLPYPVQGLDAPGVDCYVTVRGPSGETSKCTYAGRAIAPAVETIRCLDQPVGSIFWVNGREIRVVENGASRYDETESYGVNDFEYYVWGSDNAAKEAVWDGAPGANWSGLPNICTSNVQIMSLAFYGDDETNLFGFVDDSTRSTNYNYVITQWDTQRVVSMSEMFYGAPYFDQPIGVWNTSRVGVVLDPPPCDSPDYGLVPQLLASF